MRLYGRGRGRRIGHLQLTGAQPALTNGGDMPRGRRRAVTDVTALEDQLSALKQRQTELRQQIRRLRNSQGEVRKLEEKLAKQLGPAKWTVNQIKQLQPDWDEVGFYHMAEARQPAPRGRRRKVAPAG
jgi:hypothetical protein